MFPLPEAFAVRTRALFGEELWCRYASALEGPVPVSVRLNAAKAPSGLFGADERVPWCPEGRYLSSRPQFTLDPLLHAGAYYVQEASSMIITHILRSLTAGRAVDMLDMCAAPGGKSTAALAALAAGSTLTANEPIRPRANILAENIIKWGDRRATVTSAWPRDWAASGRQFDVVLCDVPCSGEGMFQSDEEARRQWSPRLVADCAAQQREIVGQAWQCLRPGGLLIYSTCTFNTEEDEENVRWIMEELGAEPLAVDCPKDWNIAGSLLDGFDAPVLRFVPGRQVSPATAGLRGRGLFAAVLRRSDDSGRTARTKGKTVPHVLHSPDDLYETKGKVSIPRHALAMLTTPERNAFPRAELDRDTALAYLRREAIALSGDTPRGYVIVTYQGLPLGFVKNLGTRANNLYPKEWRILKEVKS